MLAVFAAVGNTWYKNNVRYTPNTYLHNLSEVDDVIGFTFYRFLLNARRLAFKLTHPAAQSNQLRLFQSKLLLGDETGLTRQLLNTCMDRRRSFLRSPFWRLGDGRMSSSSTSIMEDASRFGDGMIPNAWSIAVER
jgi:hypothetical protein